MRRTSDEAIVGVRPKRVFTPIDTGHNNNTWTRVGVMGLPILVRGLRRLMCCAISDQNWAYDIYVYNEDQSAFLLGPVQIDAGVGRAGGQVQHQCVMIGEGEFVSMRWCDYVVFRGRFAPGIGNSPNSLLRAYGER